MPSVTEGLLTFEFPDGWQASKFDEWSFYRNQFQTCVDPKAVDILAIEPKVCLWNIEVRDYRRHRRQKTIDLADEIAVKVRDTLAALTAAKANANDVDEKSVARAALQCPRLRVVLHLEQPAKHSRPYPRAISPVNLLQRLRKRVRAIDPHPLVVEMQRMSTVPWHVRSVTEG